MYRLEHPFWLLGVLFALIIFLFFVWKRSQQLQRLKSLFSRKYWKDYLPNFRLNKHWIGHVLLFLGVVSLSLALANPQKRGTPKWALKEGKEVVIALDLSNSMLAEDLAPTRLVQAKEFIKRFVTENKGDRLGLIVFAGNAYVQIPITSDPSLFMMHLQGAHPDNMPLQGTRIAEAFSKADQLFSEEALKNKVLVLVSDGEDHESEAVSMAKEMRRKGITIYTVGVGSEAGGKIMNPQTGAYRIDAEGQEVLSKINVPMLTELAEVGGGQFFNLQQISTTVSSLQSALTQLAGDEYQAWMPGVATSYAFPLMGLALLCFSGFFILVLFKRQRYDYA